MTSRSAQRGLTLLELMVAIGIVAVLFGGVASGIGALTGSDARQAAGELAGTIRSVYDTAALSGKTCRIVFDLPARQEGDDGEGEVVYRAECAASAVTTSRDRDEELKRAADEEAAGSAGRARKYDSGDAALKDLFAEEERRVENAANYSEFTSEEVGTRKFPSNVQVHVWTRHQQKPATSGKAFLYFFPQGYTEKAHVYVRQGDNVWTIAVSPLTGKTVVHGEELEVPR